MNSITPEHRQAYENTRYCVYADTSELMIRINRANAAIDALLTQRNVKQAAFITAWNPASNSLSAVENENRHQQLVKDVAAAGFAWLDGEGRDPAGEWPAERSILILAIGQAQATELAAKYGQNAYVWCEAGRPAVLVYPE